MSNSVSIFVSLAKPRMDAKILHLGKDKFSQNDIVSLPKLRMDAKILHLGK